MNLFELTPEIEQRIKDLVFRAYSRKVRTFTPIFKALNSSALTLGVNNATKISDVVYFGRLSVSVVMNSASVDTLVVECDDQEVLSLSSDVNAGYSGPKILPLIFDDILTNYIALASAGTSAMKGSFCGWEIGM